MKSFRFPEILIEFSCFLAVIRKDTYPDEGEKSKFGISIIENFHLKKFPKSKNKISTGISQKIRNSRYLRGNPKKTNPD